MSGCWHASGIPICWGDDVLSVVMGTLPEAELARHMHAADALVVMKTGRNLPKVRRALASAGRLEQAWLVERGTMPGQRVVRLADTDHTDCPYFAIVLVHGQGRRPEAAP
jgi:precorrin-2/cobalt-factor-2 C20-methyltransferase